MPPPVLLVFSHLRWGFVYQRPQHLLSRLAGRWRVLFVEEPVRCEGPARLEVRSPTRHLSVLVPHTPAAAPGFHDDQLPVLAALLDEHLDARRLRVDMAWLCTPMALPLVHHVRPDAVVYDCMDDLAALKDAPRQQRQRESALMKMASLVIAVGPSLYEARRDRHSNVVCMPGAVDAAHFSPAALVPGSAPARDAAALQDGLPGPRLGYFGVIDERLDTELIARLADAHPGWSVVMAGPVVKIDPAALPQRPNLHWLGMQPYERLPYLLAGWDLAMIPFALNEATRFVSPTQTLEYMAGEKAVVSTAVRDVISLHGDAVVITHDHAGFIAACEQVLRERPSARLKRSLAMLHAVALNSWDHSADCVHGLLSRTLAGARTPAPLVQGAGRARAMAGLHT